MHTHKTLRPHTHPDQAVLGLELLGRGDVVVDETEAGGLAATELRGRRRGQR